jgi:NADH-quinone oxidoreductase subunit E
MSCALMGANELMHHAERRLGVRAGSTTADGLFTLQHAECQAACTEAPTLQVNYRYRYRVTAASFDELVDDLAAGELDGEIPPHGTLGRNRQNIPADRAVGAQRPEQVTSGPAWVTIEEGAG